MNTTRRHILKTYFAIFFSLTLAYRGEANLINNGGFEQPVTGPGGYNSGYTAFGVGSTIGGAWTVVGSSANNVAVVPATEYSSTVGPYIYFVSQEGSQSLDLSGEWDNGAVTGVRQSFASIPGQMYSLSFYVGAVTTPDWAPLHGNAVINVLLNGSAFQTAVNSDPSGHMTTWKLFNYTFAATGSTTTLAFMNGSASGVGDNGLDNVSVELVPEPGVISLFSLGCGLLWVLRKKKA
jgi:hypothetical protein